MNNKILISTISVISIILIGIIGYATFNNKTNNTVAQLSSSSVARSSQLANSSQSSFTSSTINTISTLSSQQSDIKSSVIESQSSITQSVATTPVCNLPESENLVKTKDGCFELEIRNKSGMNKEKSDALLNAANNFYNKLKNESDLDVNNSKIQINLNDNPLSQDKLTASVSYIKNNVRIGSYYWLTLKNEQYITSFWEFTLPGDGTTTDTKKAVTILRKIYQN